MPGRQPSSEGSARDAQETYSVYLRSLQEGEEVDFGEFCARNSDMAEDLRKLHSIFQLGQSLATSRSFHQSIRERFGDVEEVTISLGMDSPLLSGDGGENRDSTSAPAKTGHRYEPEGEVARGGMGVIYRVKDRDLSRTIAMKVMLAPHEKEGEASEKAHSQFLSRFLEEAQVTAQLDHPGIVPVHELGLDAEGRVYFTMKLVKGRELGEICKLAREDRERWNVPRAVGVLVKACQAVAFAHARGVIHRDLKPSNIMVGRFGEVYVMDWGLAKVTGKKDLHDIRLKLDSNISYTAIRSERRAAEESSAESPIITMDGSVVGTPAFMPPEQAEGRVEEVDWQSDVYSLGAILYNFLTGQAPYVSHGARVSPHTILAAVTQGPPKRVHELNTKAPPELVAICEKAMAREKRDRYASSLELAEDLQAYLDKRVVQAYESGILPELKKWIVRNKGVVATVTVISLAVLLYVVLAGFVTWRRFRQNLEDLEVAIRQDNLPSARSLLAVLEDSYGEVAEVFIARRRVEDLDRQLGIRKSGEWRERGLRHWQEFLRLRSSRDSVEETGRTAVGELEPWRPVWDRLNELKVRNELARIDEETSDSYNKGLLFLHRALEEAPDGSAESVALRQDLAKVYWNRYQEAQDRGSVSFSAKYFWNMIQSQGVGGYSRKDVDKLTFSTEPPGAEIYCFRYETREGRLVPLPFDPRPGMEDPQRGLLGDLFLVVEKIWRDEGECPFRRGDRFLRIGQKELRSRGELSASLAGQKTGESVEVEILREGESRTVSWIPFPAAFYERMPEGSPSPLRPGRLVDIRVQLGFTFEGYPLDFVDGCRIGRTGAGRRIEVTLPRGSYLFVLRKKDYELVRYPVVIPSEVREIHVKLPRPEEVPEDFVYIPAGKFSYGGDREAYLGFDRAAEDVPGFLIGRHEVTFGEYLEFIRDIAHRIDENGYGEPLTDWSSEELSPYITRATKVKGRIRVIPKYSGNVYLATDKQGKWQSRLPLDYPLLGVSVLACMDYAIWLTRKHEGRWRFRLPGDLEWEKAARGVDRRTFVWGDYLVWTFCNSGWCRYPDSRKGSVERVGSYPFDESVFGVHGMAGSMKEPSSRGDLRFWTLRGGEWQTIDHRDFRIATRNRTRPHFIWNYVGLRLVAELPED